MCANNVAGEQPLAQCGFIIITTALPLQFLLMLSDLSDPSSHHPDIYESSYPTRKTISFFLRKILLMSSQEPQSTIDQIQHDTTMIEVARDFASGENSYSDDDAFSFVSETSTIEYNQEPYASFREKVTELSSSLFSEYTEKDIILERMKGGSSNRIIGITLSKSRPWCGMVQLRAMFSACMRSKARESSQQKQYILRIPRDTVHDLFYQAITLAYLDRKLPYPVPKTVCYDSSADNPLGRAYMLQKRIPGKPLNHLWPTLSLEQRKSAARCIAEIVRDLHKVENPCAGIISPRNTIYDLEFDLIKLEPIPMSRVGSSSTSLFNARIASPRTTHDLLLSLVARQRAYAEATDLPPFDNIWTSFIAIINKLHEMGALPDKDMFHLYHADLQSRNLLFTTPTPDTVCLTGILDWDSALFAPKCMSTRAPFFLWTSDDADEFEEGDALLESNDAEMCEYKRIFEEVVGEKFCKDAYRSEFIDARRLWRFLVHGIRSGGDLFMAELLIEQWEGKYAVADA
jgi:hypothetical protein